MASDQELVEPKVFVAASLDLWHQRLGHAGTSVIRENARNKSVIGLELSNVN